MRSRRMSTRHRRARRRRIGRRLGILAGVLILAGLAMTPGLREKLCDSVSRGVRAVAAFAMPEQAEAEWTLPGMEVYALQLGAYDSGELAQSEMQRLYDEGIPCMIWQREQMRIVCAVALTQEALDMDAAQGREACVIADTLVEVKLRLSAGTQQLPAVLTLLGLPDATLRTLLNDQEDLAALTARVREQAEPARTAHPGQALYTQLAQSLVNWCDLMDQTLEARGEDVARPYAAVTMCTLCRELRLALCAEAESTRAEGTDLSA